MATTIERAPVSPGKAATRRRVGPSVYTSAAVSVVALAAWAVVDRAGAGATAAGVLRPALALVWALAGLILLIRRPAEPLGAIASAAGAVAAVGSLVDPLARVAIPLLPALGMHLLLSLPSGFLGTRARRILTWAGYTIAAGIALYWIAAGSSFPRALIGVETALAVLVGTTGFAERYGRVSSPDRRRMKWVAWAVTVAGGIAILAVGLGVLVDWPSHVTEIATGLTVLVPIALMLGTSARMGTAIDRLLAVTISLAGLTAVVVGVYLAIVLGLGRVPHKEERTLLVLSMIAAAIMDSTRSVRSSLWGTRPSPRTMAR